MAEAQAGKRDHYWKRLGILGFLFLLLALFFGKNFQVVVVQGKSMEPTFHDQQVVIVTRTYWLFGPIERGDVVVIRRGEELLIKRVVALPGDEIPPEYLPDPESLPDPGIARKVKPGHLYVVGDNLEHSEDSRTLGPIPFEEIVGKVPGARREEP